MELPNDIRLTRGITLILGLVVLILADVALGQVRPPAPEGQPSLLSSTTPPAPGYCPSFGGSVYWESINDVVVVENSDGTLTIKVDVWIANPSGCVSGEPCPAYETNPEYVNAWIDFDGNGSWDPNERVMDAVLNDYTRVVNFRGVMHTESVTAVPPNAVRPTWLRVNLGWGYDPNDPCEDDWSYGNVRDKEVLSTVKVAELWSQGDVPIREVQNPVWAGQYSERGQFIKAIKDDPAAWPLRFGKFSYQVFLQSFPANIGLTPRVECQYEFKGSSYRLSGATNSFTGWSGTIFGGLPRQVGDYALTLRFKIYDQANSLIATQSIEMPSVFVTYYVPIVQNAGPPLIPKRLWYEKAVEWAGGTADPNIMARKMMEAVYSHTTWKYRNVRTPWDGLLENQFDRASCRSMTDIWINLLRVLGVLGVSVAEEKGTYGHGFVSKPSLAAFDGSLGYARESYYFGTPNRWVWDVHYFGQLGNSYYDPTLNMTRAISDRAPLVEWEITGKKDIGTVNILFDREYKWVKGLSGCARLIDNLDRSGQDKGAWNTALYDIVDCPPSLPLFARSKPGLLGIRFTRVYTESPVDPDADGIQNAIRAAVEVENTVAQRYLLRGLLAKGDTVVTSRTDLNAIFSPLYSISPNAGTSLVELLFSGEDIGRSDMDGPFTVRLALVDTSGAVADTMSFLTNAYDHRQFGELSARFSSITEDGADVNGDGLFEWLIADVDFLVTQAQQCYLEGSLVARGAVIASAAHSVSAVPGTSSAQLKFAGTEISASGLDGPYQLRVVILDDNSQQIDGIDIETKPYSATTFQFPRVHLTGVFADRGVDVNDNGLFDSLSVNIGVEIDSTGDYLIAAWLRNEQGEDIAWGSQARSLIAGTHTMVVSFPGEKIYEQQKEGAYTLSYIVVSDSNNPVLFWKQDAYTTGQYAYTAFERSFPELVATTGQFSDLGIDDDGDGLYDSLAIDIGLTVADSGAVWVLGRLVGAEEREIAGAATSVYLTPNTAGAARLLFDGRYIFGNRTDGPYHLRSLHVYHVGNPDQEIVIDDAHTTSVYQYTDFELAGTIGGTVTDSVGTPIANALVFVAPGNQDYTNTEGTYNLVVFQDSAYTVTIRGPNGAFSNLWSIVVNGQPVGQGDSVRVQVSLGQVSQVDFRAPGIFSGVETSDHSVPLRFELQQNHPNPFNSSTTIRYALAARSYVTLTIFNPLGQVVRELVNGEVDAGYHSVQFETSGLGSGVYLYRLTAGEFVATKKSVLLK